MKKFLSVLLSILMVLSLSACNKVNLSEVLYIVVIDAGYGDEFIYEAEKRYEEKTGIPVEIKSIAMKSYPETTLPAGPKNNEVDLYFGVGYQYFDTLAKGGSIVSGYDTIMADLTDVYETIPEGYGGEYMIGEMVGDKLMETVMYNGKPYFVPWAIGVESFIYNVDLFEKYNLTVPRTTDELLGLCQKIQELKKKEPIIAENGKEVYPLVITGGDSYYGYAARTWFAQYEGIEAYENFLQGKNADGDYTYEIYALQGRLECLEVLYDLLAYGNGNTNVNSLGYSFTQAQLKFLEGEAFMMSNGDWLEREMSGNFDPGSVNIRFMRLPVISSIIDNLPDKSVKNDAQLIEIIDYLDGGKSEELRQQFSGNYTQDDITFIEQARRMCSSQIATLKAFIPSYSNRVEEAKNFLTFMYSKEMQSVVMEKTYGNMFPMLTSMCDPAELDAYETLSSLQKSKYEFLYDCIYITNNYAHPMYHLGGLSTLYYPTGTTLENRLAVVPSSASFETPEEIYLGDYNYYKSMWSTIMSNAGVSN